MNFRSITGEKARNILDASSCSRAIDNAPFHLDTSNGDNSFSDTATSGQPVDLIYSETSRFDVSDLLNYCPNVTGNPKSPRSLWVKTATSLNGYLNPTTVSVPTNVSQPYGNAGRNSLRGNAIYQTNASLHKEFRLWDEGSNLDSRCEAFNAFNNANHTAPVSNPQDGSFVVSLAIFRHAESSLLSSCSSERSALSLAWCGSAGAIGFSTVSAACQITHVESQESR